MKKAYLSCHVCSLMPAESSCPVCNNNLYISITKLYPTKEDLMYHLQDEVSNNFVPLTKGFEAVTALVKNGSMRGVQGNVGYFNHLTGEVTIELDSLTKLIMNRSDVALRVDWEKIIKEIYGE